MAEERLAVHRMRVRVSYAREVTSRQKELTYRLPAGELRGVISRTLLAAEEALTAALAALRMYHDYDPGEDE